MNSFERLADPSEIAECILWVHHNPVINGTNIEEISDRRELEMVEYVLNERRERVFIILAGIFICSMTLLNVIGITVSFSLVLLH